MYCFHRPCHDAVARGNLLILETLLGSGANVHIKNSYGFTPLFYAAANDVSAQIVGSLLRAGANVHDKDNDGVTALIRGASLDIVSLDFIFTLIHHDPTQLFLKH